MKAAVDKSFGMCCVLLAALFLLQGCARYYTLNVQTARPADIIYDDHCVACRAGEKNCRVQVSRETCWFFDSSKGYFLLTAVGSEGLCATKMFTTCDVKNRETIVFSEEELASGQAGHPCGFYLRSGGQYQPSRSCAEERISGQAGKKEKPKRENDVSGVSSWMALFFIGPVVLDLLIPSYTVLLPAEEGGHGLQWEAALDIEKNFIGHSLAASYSFYPQQHVSLGRAIYRFWPLFGHGVHAGLGAGAFFGPEGKGPVTEFRLRFPFPAELKTGGIFASVAWEPVFSREMGRMSLTTGVEFPIPWRLF